jgi:hypothetical protein
MNRLYKLLFLILLVNQVAGQQDSIVMHHLPKWSLPMLENNELAGKYKIVMRTNPYYFENDFNADGIMDIAFLVESKLDSSTNVMFINGGKNLTYIVNCGNPLIITSKAQWVDSWFALRDKIVDLGSNKSFIPQCVVLELKGLKDQGLIVFWKKNKYLTKVKSYK